MGGGKKPKAVEGLSSQQVKKALADYKSLMKTYNAQFAKQSEIAQQNADLVKQQGNAQSEALAAEQTNANKLASQQLEFERAKLEQEVSDKNLAAQQQASALANSERAGVVQSYLANAAQATQQGRDMTAYKRSSLLNTYNQSRALTMARRRTR